ncbi:hypothetical protein IW261DRAFT_906807 [Armillaria novae-zelandiae]|uniref:Uncharacterized protein n=1 Tax=Armillaria novae-zelandiae TaxID=153914 RepID=A0AA39NSN1_9AGAR|nr:hypothetical protein IW261DRAFT_906807 [Armillaria novae-zelandiae]
MTSPNETAIAHGNAFSSPSLALLSSSTSAQVVGSPSNNAVSVKSKSKGKLSKFLPLWRRSRTNTTGDVATTSHSASPVLQSNTSSTMSSPPFASAQIMAMKISSDNNNPAGTSSRNMISNATVIVEIVKSICDVLDNVPYVKGVAGLVGTAIKIVDEVDACKGEWDKVKGDLLKVRDIVLEFRHGQDNSALLPDDVKAAFRELEICLREILDAVIRYENVRKGKLVLVHGALKEEAMSCVRHIDMAVKIFQTKVLIGTHVVVEQTRLTGEKTYHGVEKILATMQEGLAPSSSLNLNVLTCPAPSQYFTGRESELQKLSSMLAAPVVTLFSPDSNALSAFVHSFDHSSRLVVVYCVACHELT